MGMEEFATYGVPEFYMNVPIVEPAGGGNVRVWNCVRKCGILVPVCAVIIPAVELLAANRILMDAALLAFNTEAKTAISPPH